MGFGGLRASLGDGTFWSLAAASPVVFNTCLLFSLRRSVAREIRESDDEGSGDGEDTHRAQHEDTELGTVLPIALSIPFANVFVFLILLAVRRGYVLTLVMPSICTAATAALGTKLAALCAVTAAPIPWLPCLSVPASAAAVNILKAAMTLDAGLLMVSAYPAFLHLKHRLYRAARRDILRRQSDQDMSAPCLELASEESQG